MSTSPIPQESDFPRYRTENAYHGTDENSAASIVRDGQFRLPQSDGQSAKSELRFGHGIYFWEHSKEAARRWVKIHSGYAAKCKIVRATIDCEKLLDLLTNEHFTILKKVQNTLARKTRVPVNKIRHAAVLNFMARVQLIDCVRLISKPLALTPGVDPNSGLVGPVDVMICVYKTNNIVVSGVVS